MKGFLFLLLFFSASVLFSQPADFAVVLEKLSLTNPYCVYIRDMDSGSNLFVSDPLNMGPEALPAGSIIKIYSIIAKYKNHPVNPDETYFCAGYGKDTPSVSKCWLKKGHGNISLLNAIAQSCNTYFYHYVQDVDFALFLQTLREYGILRDSANWGRTVLNRDDQVRAMIGKLNILKVKPLDLMDGCDKLFGRSSGLPGDVRDILTEGMSLCYRNGTASVMRKKLRMPEDLPVLCKTGTGMLEEEGKVYFYKTTGVFLGIAAGKTLVLVVVKESTGADKASLLGLSMLRAAIQKDGGLK